jgi:hypothetical protein
MYNFAFIDNLAPKVTSDPLARGSVGHLAFQRYAEARLAGQSHESAYNTGMTAFTESMAGGVKMDVVANAQFLWQRYMDFHQGWPNWIILGTERRADLVLTDTINFPIRYDLYIQERDTRKYCIVDFKFAYEFWKQEDHDINAQMPKYISVMKANGFQVDKGYLEEIRTRTLGAEKSADHTNLWRRTPYFPTGARFRNMLHQQVSASLQIERHRNLDPEQREAESIPVFNKHGVCKFCNFKSLCNSMTEGKRDLSVDKRVDYVENTYGYNQQIMEDLL